MSMLYLAQIHSLRCYAILSIFGKEHEYTKNTCARQLGLCKGPGHQIYFE